VIRNVFAAKLALALTLFLTSCPGVAFAASTDNAQQGVGASGNADPKSEAAEAWDAVKDTKNPALLEAFIKRYGSTFFAELAKARLDELKAAAAKPPPPDAAKTAPTKAAPTLQMPADGTRESAVLYDEDPSDPKGQQYTGSVVWRTETIKAAGKPDELAAHADIDIPSRGLRLSLSLRRNLDPLLPASHTIELTFAMPTDFRGGGIANVPGILMKSNLEARGTPLAGLAVKVTDGFFLVGLSSVATDRQRNVGLLLGRGWFDIPMVYTNQRRAILAIGKGESGDRVFKTVAATWGSYPNPTQPETAEPEQPKDTMPEEWKRTMTGRPKAQ
jgi:hypothetical protein